MRIVLLTDTHWGYSELGNIENVKLLEDINRYVPRPFTVLHTGDAGSHERYQRQEYYHMLREAFSTEDVGIVLGNHDHWAWTDKSKFRVKDLVSENAFFAKEAGINYLPNEPIEKDGVYICGFNGWYHDIYMTRENAIPHLGDPSDGRRWLSQHSYQEFGKRIKEVEDAKAQGLRTVLCTHFGFVKKAADTDYKALTNGDYFGANPLWETMLDNVDYLFYGHSHVAFDDYAMNGRTRVVNAGSDYERPTYKVIEV